MKKLIAAVMFGSAAWVSSFAQGNFTFNNNGSSAVYDGGGFKGGRGIEVAVMWTTDLSAVPTTFLNGAPTPTNFSYASWEGIFTDPNFHPALSTAAGNPIIETTVGSSGPGAGIYLGGIKYILGTSPGQTIQLYVLGWANIFGLDPVVAASYGADVGFSAPIQYTLGSTLAPGGALGNAGISAFGVWPVPEPSTLALTGLTAATLLIFRHRQSCRPPREKG